MFKSLRKIIFSKLLQVAETENHEKDTAVVDVSSTTICQSRIDAGEKAEVLFFNQAREHGLLAEHLDQSRETFHYYQEKNLNQTVKRADFYIPELSKKVQIEVKCFSIFWKKELGKSVPCYSLKYEHFKKHEGMIDTLKLDDLIYAFYERDKDEPKKGSLRMIAHTQIGVLNKGNEVDIYNKDTKNFDIPLGLMKRSFDLIDDYR